MPLLPLTTANNSSVFYKIRAIALTLCVFSLENAIIATKREFGFARSERVTDHPLLGGNIERCVSVGLERIGKVNALTSKENVARIDKIKISVIRHSDYGTRSYCDFITKKEG